MNIFPSLEFTLISAGIILFGFGTWTHIHAATSPEILEKRDQYSACAKTIKESLSYPKSFKMNIFESRKRLNITDDGKELDIVMHYEAHDKYGINKQWEALCHIKNKDVELVSQKSLGLPGLF